MTGIARAFGGAHPRSRGENSRHSQLGCVSEGSSPLTRGKQDGPNYIAGRLRLIPAHAGKTRSRIAWPRTVSAHPRSRGENRIPTTMRWTRLGSSPLTRGKRAGAKLSSPVHRLIPAHAGKTAGLRGVRFRREAHPRSRGENQSVSRRCGPATGSSPLTRGKPISVDEMSGVTGLIPAHAGKARRTSG